MKKFGFCRREFPDTRGGLALKMYNEALAYLEKIGGQQHGLFDPPDTRKAARESIAEGACELRERVFLEIVRTGGATDEELQNGLAMNPNTERPRRRELAQARRVIDGGARRPTASGRKAIVWVKAP